MAQLNFDASQVAPDAGVAEAIPAGWYNVMIDESEMKPTKDGNGAFLAMRFTVLDGQFVNRKVFTRLNLRNANPVAQEIAYKQLSAICHAVGVMQVADSTQLHGRPLKIKVKVRAASGDYEASNEISAFKNINEQVDGPAAAPAGGAPAGGAPWGNAPAAAPTAAPWAPQQPAAAVAPAQQFAPQQPAAAAAPAPAWQPPAAQQPWQAAPAAAPAPVQQFAQPAPVQQPVQAQAPASGATPPWMQQATSAAPAATPPWAAPAQG